MRGFVSKQLRHEARVEMKLDKAPARSLAENKRTGEVINDPHSIRALYLKLKAAYKRIRAFAGTVKLPGVRTHKPHQDLRKQPDDRIMTIRKPLDFILEHCPPMRVSGPDGMPQRDALTGEFVYEPHPVYRAARHAANKGRGDLVQKMARQFLPA